MTLSESQLASIEQNPYRQDFPLLAKHPDITFLDSAATSQRPEAVLAAERGFYETMNANPLRGLYRLSVEATSAIESARRRIAGFIGATDDAGQPQGDEIVFTRNTSESLNLVAGSLGRSVLKPGDEVVISIMEHHSNLIPWQQACRAAGATLVYLRPDDQGVITDEEIAAKIGSKTKIVSVVHISNVLGVLNPVERIARAAHEAGAYMIVDGAQSVPHMPVDVQKIGCDFFAFSAHKAFGPMGIGVLWGRKELLDAMPPFLTGGEMIDSVTEEDAVWSPVPEKFEAGTQDAAGIYAAGMALSYIDSIGFDYIQAREAALVAECMRRMAELPFIEIVGPDDAAAHHGVVSFNVKGVHPHDVSGILDGEDVAIRAGHHCAQPLLTWLGVPSCCRASFAFYNERRDIDALIHALKTVWSMFNA